MRVLVVTNDYPPRPGGIQQYLGNLVAHSSAEILVLGPSDAGAADDQGIVRGHARYMLPSRRTRAWVERYVEEFSPDVIVFGAPHPLAQLGPGLTRKTGIPYVVVAHGAEVTLPAALPGLRQILGRTFRHAALVFTVSAFTERRVEAIGSHATAVLGAGVDLDSFRPRKRDANGTVRLICVSRFVPRKGHLRVIRAAEVIAAAGQPTEVVIVGRGRLEMRIRRAADRASVPVAIEVEVPWERLPDAYGNADIFVMPARSRWFGLEVEGLGIVYLEAAAAGLPVIAGRSGGAPETVVPGETGYLAESVPEIIEAVRLVMEHPADLGHAGRARAEERYGWQSVANRFDAALDRLISA